MTDALSQGAADQSHYRRHLEECLARLEEENYTLHQDLALWKRVELNMVERIARVDAENRHLREELATWESVRMALAERVGEAEEQNREMRDLLRRITEQTLWPSLASAIYEAHAWLAAHPEEGEHATK